MISAIFLKVVCVSFSSSPVFRTADFYPPKYKDIQDFKHAQGTGTNKQADWTSQVAWNELKNLYIMKYSNHSKKQYTELHDW